MDANSAAFVDFGFKQPVSEDNTGSGTAHRNLDRLAVAVERDEAPAGVRADGERQASEVARADFRSAAAERIQAAVQVLGYIQRFVVGHGFTSWLVY